MNRLALLSALCLGAACGGPDVLCDGCTGNISILDVSPTSFEDSAPATSGPRFLTIHALNVGGGNLLWHAVVLHSSAWLSLQPDTGKGGDSTVAQANPAGLAVGDYRDTVVVVDLLTSAARYVPVDFRVLP
jgi:hypothetical protein